MSQKTIFLDRDGVINKIVFREGRPTSPRHIDEFEIEADVDDSLKRLHAAGFMLFVVTNQPELARGLLTAESLRLMTKRIMGTLTIDGIGGCRDEDKDGGNC